MINFVYKGHNNIVPCTGDVNCGNGCCRNSPCLNGGTCTEVCESTSVRYRCSCPLPFVGKHCESWLRRSCQEYKLAGFRWSRLFTLIDDSHQTFRVFCDFDSEPGFAWNLIESFNLSSKDLFQVILLRKDHLSLVIYAEKVMRMWLLFSTSKMNYFFIFTLVPWFACFVSYVGFFWKLW